MRKLKYEEVFAQRPTRQELAQLNRFPIYCLAENIRSLYNVGSIFRTSDAIRAKKLFLAGYTGFPPRKEIEKTALGATESVPWQHYPDAEDAVKELRSQNIQLIALEHTSKSCPFYNFEFTFPFCLMIGNEVDGLSESLVAEADAAIEIPMFGLKQSLNVSVAYGVVIYHVLYRFIQTGSATEFLNNYGQTCPK